MQRIKQRTFPERKDETSTEETLGEPGEIPVFLRKQEGERMHWPFRFVSTVASSSQKGRLLANLSPSRLLPLWEMPLPESQCMHVTMGVCQPWYNRVRYLLEGIRKGDLGKELKPPTPTAATKQPPPLGVGWTRVVDPKGYTYISRALRVRKEFALSFQKITEGNENGASEGYECFKYSSLLLINLANSSESVVKIEPDEISNFGYSCQSQGHEISQSLKALNAFQVHFADRWL
ncbi:Interphotoreceptor matrix proteoglycan 1 [Manis javanica]|nr:Interphotoreceptor matrix proteoglycan 1 [Manis javanica]